MRTLVLILGFLASSAAAPDAWAVFIKTQMDRIDMEPLFDNSYFLDVLSFSNPVEWEDEWSASTAGYRINGASLDCCDLLLQQDLRFQRRLVDGLMFRYSLVQQDDKDVQDFHQWLELEQNVGLGFSGLFFGEPTFRKEDSDIGLGLAYRRPHGWNFTYRHYFVDFNFNQRGSTTQRYDHLPSTDQFTVERPIGRHLLTGYLELDYPLRRNIPDENRQFNYRRTTATAAWHWRPTGRWNYRARYTYQFQDKGNRFNPDPTSASLDSRRQVHQLLAAMEGPISSRDRLEAGGVGLERTARSDNASASQDGVFYRRWEIQPYARWRRLARSWLETELAAFFSGGEERARHPGDVAASRYLSISKAKIGTGAEFIFGPSERVGLYATWNLDTPAAHPWGGGNVRAMFAF